MQLYIIQGVLELHTELLGSSKELKARKHWKG